MSGIKGKSGRKPRPESEKGKPWSKPVGAKSRKKISPAKVTSIRLSQGAVAAKSALEAQWGMNGTKVIEKALLDHVNSWCVPTENGDVTFDDWAEAFTFAQNGNYETPKPNLAI
jgi:hypothetical protein